MNTSAMKSHNVILPAICSLVLSAAVALFATSVRSSAGEKKLSADDAALTIELLNVPNITPGPDEMGPIDGKASGTNLKDCKVVLYARGDKWYVQPLVDSPETSIKSDGTFENTTHGGFEYAALLVKRSYQAAATLARLPNVGGDVLAISRKMPKTTGK